MKRHPKLQAERQRLLLHLEEQKNLVRDDVQDLKNAARPLSIVRNVIGQARNSFRDNSLATQGTRLALTLLPGAPGRFLRRPLVAIAAQIAVPLLVRRFPEVVHFVKENAPVRKLKAGAFRMLRHAVGNLRQRIARRREPLLLM